MDGTSHREWTDHRGVCAGPLTDAPTERILKGFMPGTSLSSTAKQQIAKLPEVVGLVVTDAAGAVLEASLETTGLDGETVGAVQLAAKQALARCGNALALGPLQRFTITGPRRASLVSVFDHKLLGIFVDPTKPIGAFERKLEAALDR